MSCDCKYCSKIDSENRSRAFKEWQDGVRDIVFDHWDWECGDGCCSEYGINVYVNDYNLGVDGSDTESTLKAMFEFLGYEDVHIEDKYDDSYYDELD